MPNVDGHAEPSNQALVQRCNAEIDRLSAQQNEAMEKATFVGMTEDEAREYNRRRDRIAELLKEVSTI